jgi:hypothetical protein
MKEEFREIYETKMTVTIAHESGLAELCANIFPRISFQQLLIISGIL